MEMTSQEKYNALLEELGALLQSKNTTINCQRWQIDALKSKLEEAEKEMAEDAKQIAILKAEIGVLEAEKERDEAEAKNASETHLLLDSNAIGLLREINSQLRDFYEDISGEIGCVKKLEEVQQTLAFLLPINGGAA